MSRDRHLFRYMGPFGDRVIARAEGTILTDTEGGTLLDFTSGQMCATLGHNHPRVREAIERVLREGATHLFSAMLSPEVIGLADDLAAMLPPELSKAMFLSTGAESNEAALRMARTATGGHEIVALDRSWHGQTGGAQAHTYNGGREGAGPAAPGAFMLPSPNCFRCPIRHCRDACDMTCLEVGMEMVDRQSTGAPAAVIAEPVQSSAGIIVPPEGYFVRLKRMCEERGMLLILDEAQTAFGRLGADFAFREAGVTPDILTLSKTLGGGLPLSATVTGPGIEAACAERGFLHITSHVSDPLPAAAGRAVLAVLAEEDLIRTARDRGAHLRAGLDVLHQRYEEIGDVRGRGLLLGVELVKDREGRAPADELGLAVTRRCLELGLSMNIRANSRLGAVWRIAPPLTVTEAEIDRGLEILDGAFRECRDRISRG